MSCPTCGLPLDTASAMNSILPDVLHTLESIDPSSIPPRKRKQYWDCLRMIKEIVAEGGFMSEARERKTS